MHRTRIVRGVPLSAAEIKVLAQSPVAIQALIDHYDHEEAKFEAADAADAANPLEERRHQLEQALRDGLKCQVPAPPSQPAPGRMVTHEQMAAFDLQLAQLGLTDPLEGIGRARWVIDQLWWKCQSLESVVRRIDDAVSPRVAGARCGLVQGHDSRAAAVGPARWDVPRAHR